MHRLFVALRPPRPIRDLLAGAMRVVPGARWQDDDQLHLTLRFIGEVDGRQAEEIVLALGRMVAPAPTVAVAGVGSFGKGGLAHSLWAGIAPATPLTTLHRKVDRTLVAAGVAPDRRAFVPHVTLARLPRSLGTGPAVARWLAGHAALASPPFTLDRLVLYESTLGPDGARYDERAAWPLVQPLANTPQAIRSPDAPDGSVL